MITRCRGTAGEESKKKYLDKGIKVCERWHSFTNFFEDMADSHFEGATIERINNNEGYYPENCKWATITEQANNKSTTAKIYYNGKYINLNEAATISNRTLNGIRLLYHRKYKHGLITVEQLLYKKSKS